MSALPNLIVIGAAKCGTSSLHYYLDLHPEVQMSRPKELNFFISEDGFDPDPYLADPSEAKLIGERANWDRGVDWYASFFSPEAPVRGETSVAYTYPWYRDVADRVAEVVPETRLVYVVRDPIERIVSHYQQYRLGGREWRPLDASLVSERNGYVAPSRYASALAPYLERFPRERILVVRQDELLHRRREAMREVFGFLGVDDSFWSEEMEVMRNLSEAKGGAFRRAERWRLSRAAAPFRRLPQGIRARLERVLARPGAVERPVLDETLRNRLVRELEPEVRELERITGWDLAAWRRAD